MEDVTVCSLQTEDISGQGMVQRPPDSILLRVGAKWTRGKVIGDITEKVGQIP